MTAYDQPPPQPRQFARRRPHLPDDLIDCDVRAKVVAWNRDARSMGIQPSGEMAEKRTVQRLPVTAMNENDDRAVVITGKEIDPVTRAGTIGNGPRRMPLTIGCGVTCPAGDQRGVLRDPRPVVVFDLVVDARVQGSTMLVVAQTCARMLWSWPTAASSRGHPSEQGPKIYRRSTSRARRPSCDTRRGRFLSAVSPARAGRIRKCADPHGRIRPAVQPARSHCRWSTSS